METKLFEVRDRATFIPCFGIRMCAEPDPETWPQAHLGMEAEAYLLRRAGFGFEEPLVLFGRLDGGECNYDVYCWKSGSRTMREAHRYVQEKWEELRSGDVIDIEYILAESTFKKISERAFRE